MVQIIENMTETESISTYFLNVFPCILYTLTTIINSITLKSFLELDSKEFELFQARSYAKTEALRRKGSDHCL